MDAWFRSSKIQSLFISKLLGYDRLTTIEKQVASRALWDQLLSVCTYGLKSLELPPTRTP